MAEIAIIEELVLMLFHTPSKSAPYFVDAMDKAIAISLPDQDAGKLLDIMSMVPGQKR
jgi:hypothetical protein